MNCREMNLALDRDAPDALTSARRESIDRHLESCQTCSEEWANWRAIAALSVPATPPGLRSRIATVLSRQSEARPRRSRRSVVIGGFLVAGAALAATLSLRPSQDEQAAVLAPVEAAQEPSPPLVVAPVTATADASPTGAVIEGDVEPIPGAGVGTDTDIALDPFSIAVLSRPEVGVSELETTELANCHDAIVNQLRTLGGLNVIAGVAVAAFENSGLSDREIARQLGAGNYLEVGTTNGCNARLRNTQTGDRLAGRTYAGASMPPVDGWEGFALGFAMSVRDVTLKDPATVIAEAKATLLNTALPDGQRISALNDFRAGAELLTEAYDSGVIAAAIQIGMNSTDANARVSAWVGLRGLSDTSLIPPLLHSLANDIDESVRMQAAISLNAFLGEPGVRDALLHAATTDPSREPDLPCCIPTVREAAEWASMSTAELPTWGRKTLFDESLSARSRLAPLAMGFPDGRQLLLSQLGEDAPNVVFDIGRRERDARVRQMAWRMLAQSPRNNDFTPVLVDDLANHPYEYVRSSAAMILMRYTDDSVVRETLEKALDDPSMAVRRNATFALDRYLP